MKTLKLFSLLFVSIAFTSVSFAQTKTETFAVSGNCGMCKNTIEKAATAAGASSAKWNEESKILTVKYNSSTTNKAKIQQKIADAGYDNAGFKTTIAAYDKLHGCCKYERTPVAATKEACCTSGCELKNGKCADMTSCKEKGCCSADGTCNAGASCKHSEGHEAKMDCCKDGKCTKEGHSGKGCCKKSH